MVILDTIARALPAPVARYVGFALPAGTRPIVRARIEWTGEMRLRPDADWVPFTASQEFGACPPAFVWDARVRVMPLVPVRVRDAYACGSASMRGRVAGLVTVVDEHGTPELAAGALTRWLGEAVWLPTALGPGGVVTWRALDDRSARAHVTDRDVHVSAVFDFAPHGAIERMRALRYRDVNGMPVATPFEGIYGDYLAANGVMIPSSAEVAWLLPEGRFAYWRGSPTSVHYDYD